MSLFSKKVRETYQKLSTKQQHAARFMLDHPDEVALKTADAIGKLSNTSETTVIRLCYSLGYSGFSDLQEEIRQSLIEKPKQDPFKKYRESTQKLNETNFLEYSLEQDISYIQNILAHMDKRLYYDAIKTIAKADKIMVVGLRSSFALAHWLHYSLNIIRGNAYLYRGGSEDGNNLISEMNKDWLIIAISFPRYTSETIHFVEASKIQGATVLGITDEALTPLGELSDILLTIKTPTPAGLKGMPVILSFLGMLAFGVSAFDKEQTERRIEQYEQSTDLFKPFSS
jgi:DNA-binding MurR/RpiR family transcriptional regulator